jgi:hypothetical protein
MQTGRLLTVQMKEEQVKNRNIEDEGTSLKTPGNTNSVTKYHISENTNPNIRAMENTFCQNKKSYLLAQSSNTPAPL